MTATECPGCGAAGKAVRAVTLQALLTPTAVASLGCAEGWRHCPATGCTTAYYHPESGDRIASSDVSVRIGTKEVAAPRPLCYCFGHTAEDVEAQIARTGASTIADTITEQCRRGRDRCAETNPQGSCCLGYVRAAERRALLDQAGPASDCCASTPPPTRRGRAGVLAAAGAMASAVLSSACCWLPLVLVAFGVSAGGVAGFLDAYRPWLLGAAGLLLAVAFRLNYRRVECAPGGSFEAPSSSVFAFNRVMLWTAAVAVIGFAALPSYVGRVLGETNPPTNATPQPPCPSCASRAKE